MNAIAESSPRPSLAMVTHRPPSRTPQLLYKEAQHISNLKPPLRILNLGRKEDTGVSLLRIKGKDESVFSVKEIRKTTRDAGIGHF